MKLQNQQLRRYVIGIQYTSENYRKERMFETHYLAVVFLHEHERYGSFV